MKCLAKNPDDRFASMEELITALKLRPGMMTTSSDSGRHTASPLLAPPNLDSGPGRTQARRRSALPFILAVGAVVGVALTAALLTRQDDSPGRVAALPASTTPLPPPSVPPPPPPPKVTATLHVETEPPGARVKEEGDLVCEATPCDIVYSGDQADPTFEHLLTFLKADYKLERKLVKVSASPLSVRMTRAR